MEDAVHPRLQMTNPEWRRVLELYETACELPAEEVGPFLVSAGEDDAILIEVRRMLASGSAPSEPSLPDDPDADYAGITIGRYDVIALIGRGSNGLVYSGRDRELSRPVALKFMNTNATGSSGASRFLKEAQAASALNHPNIVTIHEVTTWQGAPVIVMELIEGTTLRFLCGQRIPVARVRHFAAQLLGGLAFAHQHGIVHRDVKPENIVVRPDGYLKILDLGLARRSAISGGESNVSSMAGLPVGTLRYMSPEQCRGEKATAASDIFAAGLVLYEMLAGTHPFRAQSPLDTAHSIAHSAAPPLPHDVPAPMSNLIASMLAKDPHARPSAAAARDALEEEPPAQPIRRRSTSVALLAIAATGLLASVLAYRAWGTRPPAVMPAPALKIEPLASLLGAESQPAVSADGQRVAFAFAPDRNVPSHIFVKSVRDGRLLRLTSDSLPDFHPAFSPDGTKLAFLRRAGGRLRVMVTPAAGGGVEQKIGEVKDIERAYALMTWHPDGRHLLVADVISEARLDLAIFSLDMDTGARRQLTFPGKGERDVMPLAAPGNQTLGFARIAETGRGDILTVPLTGGTVKRLTRSNEPLFSWAWSHDGGDLLVCYRKSGRVSLYRQHIAGGGAAVREAGLDDQIFEIALARESSLAVYGSGLDDDYNVWRYPIPPNTDPPKAIIASAAFDGDARFSPDGKRIAFASTRSGQSNLWICSSDGSDPQQITVLAAGGHSAGSPNWSPDGRWLAFDWRAPDSQSSIFVLDMLGGQPRRLTGPGPPDFIPSWSGDSRWVYFASDRGSGPTQIWKVPAAGGDSVQVTRDGGFESFEAPESRDGRFLYFTKHRTHPGVWRMPVSGGPETFIRELETVADRNWQGTAEGLYFLAKGKSTTLQFYSFRTGAVKRIVQLPGQPSAVYRGLAIAPDRRSFLYLQADLAKSNLMVVQGLR
ncbi:MAG TPA: protein kinase [Bryobacteraceae bacterium]|jgi:Tol biopolymer transport system component